MTPGSATVDGIIIRWRDGRHASSGGDPLVIAGHDDPSMDGDVEIRIDATGRGPNLAAMQRACQCAANLVAAANLWMERGEMRLEAEGIDDMGDLLLRIYRGERRCDAAPVRDLAHLDPSQYTQSGGQSAVAWMRDVARILRDRPRAQWADEIGMLSAASVA